MPSDLLVLSASDVDAISASFAPVDLQCLMAQVFASVAQSERTGHHKAQGDAPSPSELDPAEVSQIPHRTPITMANHHAMFMPARYVPPPAPLTLRGGTSRAMGHSEVEDGEGGAMTSIKIVCAPKDSRNASAGVGLPGTTVVLDERTGVAKAIVNARKLTALRNAAGSLLSTCLVAQRYPRSIVAFGAGNQVAAHIELHIRFFPGVQTCTIVNRTANDRAKALLAALAARHGPAVRFRVLGSLDGEAWSPSCESDSSSVGTSQCAIERLPQGSTVALELEDTLRQADLVVCATSSTAALFPSSAIQTGTHLVLIGSYKPTMREIDDALVRRSLPHPTQTADDDDDDRGCFQSRATSRLLVESKGACLIEAGEIIQGQVKREEMVAIGDLVPLLEANSDRSAVDLDALKLVLESSVSRLQTVPISAENYYSGPVSIFKSVGVGLQDVVIAKAVVDQATKLGLGQTIQNYDS